MATRTDFGPAGAFPHTSAGQPQQGTAQDEAPPQAAPALLRARTQRGDVQHSDAFAAFRADRQRSAELRQQVAPQLTAPAAPNAPRPVARALPPMTPPAEVAAALQLTQMFEASAGQGAAAGQPAFASDLLSYAYVPPAEALPHPFTQVSTLGKHPCLRDEAWFHHYFFSSPRQGKSPSFKYLVGHTGAWMLGRTLHKGASGKVHLAVFTPMVPEHRPVRMVVKEQRQKFKASTTGKLKTRPQTLDNIEAEILATIQMRTHIEGYLKTFADEAAAGGTNPFAGVRTQTVPYVIAEHFVDPAKDKTYTITTAEAGSVDQLFADFAFAAPPQPGRPAVQTVAASLAFQALIELHAMHEEGDYAHLDIKLENITFNRHGQIKLIDYGLILPIDEVGEVERFGLEAGSLLAPEMVLDWRGATPPNQPKELNYATSAIDVHALAADVLALVAGSRRYSPFIKPQRWVTGFDGMGRPVYQREVDEEGCILRMQEVAALENTFAQNPNFVFWLGDADDKAALLRRYAPTLSPDTVAFFANCFERAPELTSVLLPALAVDPESRPTADELAERVKALLPHAGTPASAQLLAYFANHATVRAQDAAFAEIDRYTHLVWNGL